MVAERLDPINGLVRVSEKPGLGLTLDRGALERLKALKLPTQDRWIIRSRFKNGTRMYNIADPAHSIFMVRPDHNRLMPMSYAAPIETEYWTTTGRRSTGRCSAGLSARESCWSAEPTPARARARI